MTPQIISRSFSLIPRSQKKREIIEKMRIYFMKFRDLENIYVNTLLYALQKGKLTIKDFSNTSVSHIKQKIYNHLQLSQVKATGFQSIHFKERTHRCAIIYPYHAVRNWLIRNGNLKMILSELIDLIKRDSSTITWFLKAHDPPKRVLKRLHHQLKTDLFGRNQYLTSYHISNMVRQLRNIFLSHTQLTPLLYNRLQEITHDKEIIERFLNRCVNSFTRRKKQKELVVTPEELPGYFLAIYFRKRKWISTKIHKGKMGNEEFRAFKKNRDKKWNELQEEFNLKTTELSQNDLNNLMKQGFGELLTELDTDSSEFLTKHLFKPFFQKISLDYSTPHYHEFILFFQKQLKDKMKAIIHTLFLTDTLADNLTSELTNIKEKVGNLIAAPRIRKLSIPIQNKKETQLYRSDIEHLTIELSFIKREFHTFTIQDKKGRINALLEKGGCECPPVIQYKQGKMVYHLPFEVEKTRFSKQALHNKNHDIELGVDLGLKHFAVLSIMDKSKSNIKAPKEIMRYFIGQGQLFDMKFSTTTGKFESQERKPTNIKLKLINIRSEIKQIQHKLHTYQNRLVEKGISNFKMKFKYNHLKSTLSELLIKISNINKEIVNLLQHTILTIANYYNVSIIKCENLKWARHTKRSHVGAYLAFWQTHWFYSQIQKAIHLQAILNNMAFKQVDARNTSKRCSKCNTIGKRIGKAFFCPDCSFTIDSDLNAGRNVVLCPC